MKDSFKTYFWVCLPEDFSAAYAPFNYNLGVDHLEQMLWDVKKFEYIFDVWK